MKTYDIIVKDISKLEKYGFIHEPASKYSPNRYEFYSKNRSTLQMRVETDNKRVLLNSPSVVAVKTLCDMYKDGVIEFEDYRTKSKYQMSLTKEEYEAIMKLRKGE